MEISLVVQQLRLYKEKGEGALPTGKSKKKKKKKKKQGEDNALAQVKYQNNRYRSLSTYY